MSKRLDFDKALAALRNGQDLTGKDGILTPLIYRERYEGAILAGAVEDVEEGTEAILGFSIRS